MTREVFLVTKEGIMKYQFRISNVTAISHPRREQEIKIKLLIEASLSLSTIER